MLQAIHPDLRAALESIVRAVQTNIGVPIVLATCVTPDRQYLFVNRGAHLPVHLEKAQPLTHSICQHVIAMGFPLIVDDALAHPLISRNGAVTELGIAAYLGAPVRYHSDDQRGALCAMDIHRRRWTESEIKTVVDGANQINRLTR